MPNCWTWKQVHVATAFFLDVHAAASTTPEAEPFLFLRVNVYLSLFSFGRFTGPLIAISLTLEYKRTHLFVLPFIIPAKHTKTLSLFRFLESCSHRF